LNFYFFRFLSILSQIIVFMCALVMTPVGMVEQGRDGPAHRCSESTLWPTERPKYRATSDGHGIPAGARVSRRVGARQRLARGLVLPHANPHCRGAVPSIRPRCLCACGMRAFAGSDGSWVRRSCLTSTDRGRTHHENRKETLSACFVARPEIEDR